MTDSFLEKLKNVLICYSIRNTSVGYCQGMNFIGGRLLLIMGSEEQTFWLFIIIMENILPIIYYSELVGVVIETTIIENLISVCFPNLYNFLLDNNFNIPLRNFIHKWMVCLYTTTLSPEMVYTFFDFLFLDGRDTIIKNSLFIMSFIHDKLINNNNLEFMYGTFNEGLLNIHDPRTMIYFFIEKKYDIANKIIKKFQSKLEKSIISKMREEEDDSLEEKVNNRINSLKEKGVNCNPNWPVCFFDDYTQNIIDVLILKEKKPPYIINDYYYIKNDSYPDNNIHGGINNYSQTLTDKDKEVLIERHKHICDNAKLIDTSKILINDDNYKFFDIDISNNIDENKIYDKLKNSEDFDNLVKEIKIEMSKKIKPIKINEINIVINNNEKIEEYYPKDYIFHI